MNHGSPLFNTLTKGKTQAENKETNKRLVIFKYIEYGWLVLLKYMLFIIFQLLNPGRIWVANETDSITVRTAVVIRIGNVILFLSTVE